MVVQIVSTNAEICSLKMRTIATNTTNICTTLPSIQHYIRLSTRFTVYIVSKTKSSQLVNPIRRTNDYLILFSNLNIQKSKVQTTFCFLFLLLSLSVHLFLFSLFPILFLMSHFHSRHPHALLTVCYMLYFYFR